MVMVSVSSASCTTSSTSVTGSGAVNWPTGMVTLAGGAAKSSGDVAVPPVLKSTVSGKAVEPLRVTT